QRYFGLRSPDGKLMPRYLAVVNTALEPALIKKGNDRVMRARLADAQFFYSEDLKVPLASRRDKLAGVVFQKRLGTVLAKAERVERAAVAIGDKLGQPTSVIDVAREGASLAKCDLVALMVGEFPELQGDMGASYALAQGRSRAVAEVIADHYKPKGAGDSTARGVPAALVALADRLDTIVGCFGIGLSPTGTADPFGLRRAMLGVLRTLLDHDFDLVIGELVQIAYGGYASGVLDVPLAELQAKLAEFAGERLRGLIIDEGAPEAQRGSRFPADVVRACLAAGNTRPIDVRRRAAAVASLDAATRAQVGEVFKRANNIASQAPAGEPVPPTGDVHPSEAALFEAYTRFAARSNETSKTDDYAGLLREVATLAPVMHKYFTDILVMCEDLAVRENRLKLMRSISERCAQVARLELLTEK
ncbi:MAG: glycine--tRNA ligase subunit beta, partial [Myxococcales bacterium]|nr:glycine--tRNA ligase subunit beta [Myxococcales bacterium]